MTTTGASEKRSQSDTAQQKQQRFKLSLQQKNWVLTFHIGFAALWTGTVLSMFLIALRNNSTAMLMFSSHSIQ
ncbi:hypothetical protein [Oscillatoria sp. FACHB-1407]|uniref:hypothetical protein n=1 Tax=Oscillatoria sp. FACHB-1407 TaxID=2692847 RepID=UPI001F554829|nr:hypothetical protein [Oscillatoria sp. FACHB-1407]